MVDSFKGKYYFLSNFYPSIIKYDGIQYRNSEAAFQAQKLPLEMRDQFSNIYSNQAKHIGKRLVLPDDWNETKDIIMYKIIKEKFIQNKKLRSLLFQTRQKIIINGNSYHDNYWGNCICPKCENIEGQNKLGKILMKVRTEIFDV